jgi:quercetin dioxygenase-like cupin family protein
MVGQTFARTQKGRPPMQLRRRHPGWTALAVMLALWLSSSLAFGQAQPPGPVFAFQFRTAGLPQPVRFQLVQSMLHFDPGAATPFHQHPGQVVVTMLEGENTFIRNNVEQVYKVGDSFTEVPGEILQARNAGTSRMSVMATYLQPWEAPLSRPELQDKTPLPRPYTSYQFKTDVAPMPAPFDIVQAILDFAPGAATPYHTHPGIVMVTVVAGEITFNLEGVDHVYKAGESFVEVPNQVGQARNAGATPARVMASYLIPQGAPLSIPHAGSMTPAALPKTGAADSDTLSGWLVLVGMIGLLTGGWLRWHRRRRLG